MTFINLEEDCMESVLRDSGGGEEEEEEGGQQRCGSLPMVGASRVCTVTQSLPQPPVYCHHNQQHSSQTVRHTEIVTQHQGRYQVHRYVAISFEWLGAGHRSIFSLLFEWGGWGGVGFFHGL